MNGYLLIDKPKGWTSFDVVNKIRYMVQRGGLNTTAKKRYPVGHSGTLDPLATGLLVILLGNYTKRAPELTKLDKTYEVSLCLGITSTTGDEEGEKTHVSDKELKKDQIIAILKQFEGEIEQTPPIYSAIKVNGQRAYKLAREGKEVKLEPRKVTVHRLQMTGYSYPEVKFEADVSSGTYIRSLVEDIGKRLQTGAYMSNLRRTKVGNFDIKGAVGMEGLAVENIYEHCKTID